jgi:Rrf2 family transcriptional regulator, iron-sulfur cluster assembly transcription factor
MQHFVLNGRDCIAVTAMVSLARAVHAPPVPLPLLAQRLDMSLSSLEQVMGPLRRQGLVQSVRGPGGGYQLARAARDLSLAEIISAVDREPKAGSNKIHGSWPALSRAMARCLAGISLQDLLDEPPYEPVHEPAPEAGHALRRGISSRPVLEPVMLPRHANTVFSLAEALK